MQLNLSISKWSRINQVSNQVHYLVKGFLLHHLLGWGPTLRVVIIPGEQIFVVSRTQKERKISTPWWESSKYRWSLTKTLDYRYSTQPTELLWSLHQYFPSPPPFKSVYDDKVYGVTLSTNYVQGYINKVYSSVFINCRLGIILSYVLNFFYVILYNKTKLSPNLIIGWVITHLEVNPYDAE